MKSKSIAILLAGALAALAWATPPPDRIALTNARIIPIVGPEIAKGAILIEHGKIAAIGPVDQVEIPFDAREFDLTGKVVMAGLVNVHSQDPLDVRCCWKTRCGWG
jgi:cytosine/adenosine deaminase-related metal-dependent hydrolase